MESVVLDFSRKRPADAFVASRLVRRLLVLAMLSVFALLLVMRRSGESEGPLPAPSEAELAAQSVRADQSGGAEAQEEIDPALLFPGVRPDYLKTVRDDTVFRAAETDAWFHLLELLAKTEPARLQAASVGEVGYLQLARQAASYRGRVVSIAGTARKARRLDAPDNSYGIQSYYQLWVQPNVGAPDLIAVYALELPEGFPVGEDLETAIDVTGIFFKRWAYQAQDGIRTVPLVLARGVRWAPPPPDVKKPPLERQFVWSLLAAGAIAAGFVLFMLLRARRAKPNRAPESAVKIHIPDEASEVQE